VHANDIDMQMTCKCSVACLRSRCDQCAVDPCELQSSARWSSIYTNSLLL